MKTVKAARNIGGLLALVALGCDQKGPTDQAGTASVATPTGGAPSGAAPVSAAPDAELEQLKTVKAVDACAQVGADKLKAVFANLAFDIHENVPPRISGYIWDSRCVYWAGVGTMDFAKTTPTHTVDLFVSTAVSESKAKTNLARRQETAVSATGYVAQPALGEHAYAITGLGSARLFFVKGQSEVTIHVSYLNAPADEKLQRALAIARLL